MGSTNTWCINRDLLDKHSLLSTWNEVLSTRGTPVTRIELARMLDAITKQQRTNGWDAWNNRPISNQRKQMEKEIRLQDLLEQMETFGLSIKSEIEDALDKPNTVEDLDRQTDFSDSNKEDEAPKPVVIPKWKAVELQLLDVIGNTLGSSTGIDSERATTLLLLAQTRETILRNPR